MSLGTNLETAYVRKKLEIFRAFCRTYARREALERKERERKLRAPGQPRAEEELGAPHTGHTGLLKGDTEVIFNRRARTSSEPTCYRHATRLFCTTTKRTIAKNAPFRKEDRVRLVRDSAMSVARGYFIHDGRKRTMARIFLLRNLQGSPRWTRKDIKVDTRARKRCLDLPLHASNADGPSASQATVTTREDGQGASRNTPFGSGEAQGFPLRVDSQT